MKKISVIGFGKIGQAVAANVLQHAWQVTAVDIDTEWQRLFASGTYSTGEPGLNETLIPAFENNLLFITSDMAAVKGSEAIIIAIPLLIDPEKKMLDKPFLETMAALSPWLENNTVIVIETSIPVGFCRHKVLPAIEAGGCRHGKDFLLAHSPERIKSGTMLEQLKKVPKVIGGIDVEATGKAFALYETFFGRSQLYKVDSIEAAEMLKLAGMIYRDVNIALSNQLAQFANSTGVNFTDIIPLINTDGEANLLNPGIGVGGHCTPVYPYFLIENFRQAGLDFTLASQSRKINNQMAAYAVSLVKEKVKEKKALILGLSFRPNVKEDALSTTYLLNEVLLQSGFEIKVHDTEFTAPEIQSKGLDPLNDLRETNCEVVFLVTMHSEYNHLDFSTLARNGVKYFVDGRNSVDRNKVRAAGIEYIGIGH